MRFSLTTIWLGIKIRLGLAALLLGIGVYLGMVYQALAGVCWPGTQVLSGMFFFLGLGFLLGVKGIAFFGKPSPLLKPFFDQQEWHRSIVTKVLMTTMAGVVLFSILAGSLFTHWGIGLCDEIFERFLVSGEVRKAISFITPLVPAGIGGWVLGFIPGLCFMLLFFYTDPTTFFQSDQRTIQQMVQNLIILVIISLLTGGSLGYLLTTLSGERWFGVALIPVILSLLVILLSLWGKTDRSTIHHDPTYPPYHLRRTMAPELASRTSRMIEGTMILLGWLGVWQILHWRYALDNWHDVGNLFENGCSGVKLIFLASFSASGGIFFSGRLLPKQLNRFLTPIDREGLSLAGFGLWTIITAVLTKHYFSADYLQTWLPQIVISLSLLGTAWLWGMSVGLAIPAMSIGRPDSVEFWVHTLGRLGWGVLLAGPTYLLWQFLELGNLLAIAFGALSAIALGGVDLIYDEPGMGNDMRLSRTGRFIHAGSVVFLYISLGLIILFVPPLQSGWLGASNHQRITIREGQAGVASLIDGDSPTLLWSGRFGLPERTHPLIRRQAREIIERIVFQRRNELSEELRLLMVNLPYQEESWAAGANQVDIDASIREMEYKMLGLEDGPEVRGITDLYVRDKKYHLSIALLPTSGKQSRCTPAVSLIVPKVLKHTADIDGVWILLLTQDLTELTEREIDEIQELMHRLTGKFPASTIIDGPMDYRWVIFSSPRSIETFCEAKKR